jgi:mannose-6-phosphate isomerase
LVLDALNDDLTVARGTSRLWPQTERLRAALALETDCRARHREAAQAARAIETYLRPAGSGLWADGPGDDVAPAPASSFYHIIGAIAALEPLRKPNMG